MSLQILSLLLYRHYGKEAVIIIDEYDTPIQQGYSQGFYAEIIGEIIGEATAEVMENLYKLLSGQSITSYIDTNVILS